MYTIIGGDGKEYGPESADQIRRWIADGRASLATRAKAAGTDVWQRLEEFPEFGGAVARFADEAADVQPTPATAVPRAGGPRVAAEFSPLDCFSRSWDLLRNNFWPLVGVTLLLAATDLAVGVALGPKIFSLTDPSAMLTAYENFANSPQAWLLDAVDLLVMLPLWAGFQFYFQKRIRHQPATIRDLFAGFSGAYAHLIIAGILLGLLTALGIRCYLLPAVYIIVAYYPFTVLLLVDRRVSFWVGLETSRRTITRHWWSIFLMFIIAAILLFAGLIAFVVGTLVTFPLVVGAFGYAYEDLCGGPVKPEAEPVNSAVPTA